MGNEIEATFYDIDKDEIRAKLKDLGAKLIYPEFLMRRKVYDMGRGSFARVRQEGNGVVMTYKSYTDDTVITGCKEVNVKVDDYDAANLFMQGIGMKIKADQDSYRELWELDGVEITIDTWPWIPTYIEVEGPSEDAVWTVSGKLGYKKEDAHFGSVDRVYNYYYGVDMDIVNDGTPVINFEIEPPEWVRKDK
jgi:adenylate cyclase class 2